MGRVGSGGSVGGHQHGGSVGTVGANPAAGESAPVLSSAVINAAGTSLSVTFNSPVSAGAGGNGGLVLNPTGADVTLTYVSGADTLTWVFTIVGHAILRSSEETAVLGYTQP